LVASDIDVRGVSPPAAEGRIAFEVHCAPCHGPSGAGVYLGRTVRPPSIAGADVAEIVQRVRNGKNEMPAFSLAVLPDASLHALALYVHEMPATPRERLGRLGPRQLDPSPSD
jgi:ubiquinol-cytochrome c reductase cytochrome c subunit